jgi:hypothetical protein
MILRWQEPAIRPQKRQSGVYSRNLPVFLVKMDEIAAGYPGSGAI